MNNFILIQIWGSYLLEYGHNTYKEIMNMTEKELEGRFKEVTN